MKPTFRCVSAHLHPLAVTTSFSMKHLFLPLLSLGLVCHAVEPTTKPALPHAGLANAASGFEVQVPSPGPGVFADTVLQEAIDKVAAAGGGIVTLGAGDFKLSRHEGDETVIIKSNVTLRGQGYATHIYLDPTTPANELRYFPMRIGSAKVPAHNVVIEHLRYTGNDAKIGGGSIMGFNARLDEPESLLLSCDNISVRHCWIYDAKQAVGCTKPATNMYNAKRVITPEEAADAGRAGAGPKTYADADRLASQFKNWQVCNNYIEVCGNKAIELAECNGGLIAENHITNVKEGPQVIFGSRNVQIRDNTVFFTASGINVTQGSNHIRVSGNHVEPMPDTPKGVAGPCLLIRTEPLPLLSAISDIVVTGNIFRNQTTETKCTLRFMTRDEAIACSFQGITFTGNVFDGDVQFLDKRMPQKTTIRDVVFANNVCEGNIISEPFSTMASSHIVVKDNVFRQSGNVTLNASHWIWSGNTHVNGSLEIAAGAKGNVVRDNVTATPVSDHGDATVLSDNLVVKADGAP